MKIIDGTKLSNEIALELSRKISVLKQKPKLAIFQIGDNEASNVYISRKALFAKKIGAEVEIIKLKNSIKTADVIQKIKKANNNKNIHGIIVQLPVPKNVDVVKVISSIEPQKDVDGLTPENVAKMFRGENNFILPATTRGIHEIFKKYKIDPAEKKICIVGRSNLVGKPTAIYFLNKNATIIVCHSRTKNIKEHTKKADILIVAVGKAGLIDKSYVGPGSIIIDVGISKNKKGLICGDVNLGEFKVKMKTPVPGGVGPMTVACLFKNLFDAYKKQVYNR